MISGWVSRRLGVYRVFEIAFIARRNEVPEPHSIRASPKALPGLPTASPAVIVYP